jgi:hypothetical protein
MAIRAREALPSIRAITRVDRATTIRFWNVASGESELALPAEGFAAAFSSDGQRFGPAWQPGHIGLVEFTTPREFRSFRPTTKDYGAFEATFSPDNRLIASLSYGGVLLWEASSGRQLARLPVTDPKFVRFHPRGDALIVSSLNGINRWPLERKDADSFLVGLPQPLFSGPGWQDLAFDRQGTRLLAANPARSLAILSNSAAVDPRSLLTAGTRVRGSPESRMAAGQRLARPPSKTFAFGIRRLANAFIDSTMGRIGRSPSARMDGGWPRSEKIVCCGRQVRGSPGRSCHCPKKTPPLRPQLSHRTAAALPLCWTNAKSICSRCQNRSY